MAIDKSLYEAPEGIESLAEPDVEIDIDLTEAPADIAVVIELDDGGVEVDLDGTGLMGDMEEISFGANLADYMDEDAMSLLASDLIELIDQDERSRKDWVETYVEGLNVLGFKFDLRTEPWEGACGVYSTLLAEAAIRFQAETMSEVFPSQGPVKVKVLGEETKEKLEAAARVKADMNYELTERMEEYRPEHERMLFALGISGSCFKKVYFDPALNRQKSVYVAAEDVLVPYGESVVELAERVSHVMRKTPVEVAALQRTGFYRDIDLGDPVPYHSDVEQKKAEDAGFTLNEDNRHTLFEVHVTMEVILPGEDGDGVPKPYVITIDKSSNEVLAIYRNWKEGDSLYRKRQHFVHYNYIPGFGFYGLGLIHVIGGYSLAGTSIIRQLVDSGTLSNLPGGLKARGMRIKGDDTPIGPGEWRDVDLPSGSVRDNILPLPYKEPSQVLAALLDRITNEGRRLGGIADMNVSDMSANAPVGTTLALLEQTLKPMAAVQSRVHYAMKQEFKLLKEIIAEHAPEDYSYQPERGDVGARRSDYQMVAVIPVSDPNSSTMAQRVVTYQAALQMSQQAPQIYNLPELHRQMLEVLGIKGADKIIPIESDAKPQDPISENMAALIGKPMKAFIYQDHQAHIATHMSMMQDPAVMATIGQSPAAQQVMGAMQAHIAEHIAFQYRRDIEQKLGVPLPPPGEELPEEIEVQLSRLVADAAAQLSQANQQKAAQAQAQQQAQDPVIQNQTKELEIKAQEVQRKAAKDAVDKELRERKLALEEKESQEEIDIKKAELVADIESAKTGV
jgi:hypothetical protein